MFDQKDVAKMAGVSVMTVSRVINNNGYVKEETRKRVYEAIEKLNYYPNNLGRSLSNNRVNIIAAMAPISTGAIENHPYYIRLLYGIELVLVDYSYDILLSTQRQTQIKGKDYFDYFRPVMERKADALILFGAKLEPHHLEFIKKNEIIICVIGDRADNEVADIVDTDNREGIKVVLEKLYDLGHRKIAFGGCIVNNFNIMERYNGYKEFLSSKNLEIRDDYVFHCLNDIDQGEEALRQYRSLSDPPTALVCSTDNYAIGFIAAAKENGLSIPGDISVTGFDGIKIGKFIDPPLVSMNQPLEEMGGKAARLVLDRLKDPGKKCESCFFDVNLQQGRSIGPPKQ